MCCIYSHTSLFSLHQKEPFKANPIPDFDGPILPPTKTQAVTEPKTPLLHTKTRGEEHESKWKQTVSIYHPLSLSHTHSLTRSSGFLFPPLMSVCVQLDELVQRAKENAEFRAKDAKVLYKPPFVACKGRPTDD